MADRALEAAAEALREAVARAVAMVVTDIQENDLVVADAERYGQTVAEFYVKQAALAGLSEEERPLTEEQLVGLLPDPEFTDPPPEAGLPEEEER